MAFVGALHKFGLINDAPSPSERVFVTEVSDESEAAVRQVPDRETDPNGETVFSSFESSIGFSSLDLGGQSQAETWMNSRTAVKAVGLLREAFVQWYEPARIQPITQYTVTEAALIKAEYSMTRDAGDLESHGVYLARNGLYHLAPLDANGQLAGGWADADSDNSPDGYTETALTGTAWNTGVYEGFVDTGAGTGSLNATLPFPVDGAKVTLSVQIDQVHDDGNQAVRIEALDETKSSITGGVSDVTVSTTGRKSATLTTPEGTHFLKVYPVRVTSATANTAKFQIQDPCLRRGTATAYVAK